jgi:hypothetical protein
MSRASLDQSGFVDFQRKINGPLAPNAGPMLTVRFAW